MKLVIPCQSCRKLSYYVILALANKVAIRHTEKMRFTINRQKLKELASFRNWRSIYTGLAELTGFTGSYCRRVVLEKEKLTDIFMLLYIRGAGMNPNDPKQWGSLFDVILSGNAPPPHDPAWNNHKMNGQGVKYRPLSEHYDLRKPDNPNVEVEEFHGMSGDPSDYGVEKPENEGKVKDSRPYSGKKFPFNGAR